MMKIFAAFAIVFIFAFTTIGAYASDPGASLNQPTAQGTEKTKDRISRAMNNIAYGPMEVPKNLDETKTKGTPVAKCTARTRSGVERGIARIVGGVWQLATFWNSDPGCVTKAPTSSSSGTKVK